MMRGIRRLLVAEEGKSLIELAFVMPILVTLALGTFEIGRVMYAQIEVTNAARAGIAYGAQDLAAAAATSSVQAAATNDAANLNSWAGGGVTATASQVCTCTDGTAITCKNALTACVLPARVQNFVQVNTTATVTPLFYLPGLPSNYTLKGYAIMEVE